MHFTLRDLTSSQAERGVYHDRITISKMNPLGQTSEYYTHTTSSQETLKLFETPLKHYVCYTSWLIRGSRIRNTPQADLVPIPNILQAMRKHAAQTDHRK